MTNDADNQTRAGRLGLEHQKYLFLVHLRNRFLAELHLHDAPGQHRLSPSGVVVCAIDRRFDVELLCTKDTGGEQGGTDGVGTLDLARGPERGEGAREAKVQLGKKLGDQLAGNWGRVRIVDEVHRRGPEE